MAKKRADAVHIHPLPGVAVPPGDFDPPIRHVEQDVDGETWERLQRYVPPAFTDRTVEEAPEATPEDTQEG